MHGLGFGPRHLAYRVHGNCSASVYDFKRYPDEGVIEDPSSVLRVAFFMNTSVSPKS